MCEFGEFESQLLPAYMVTLVSAAFYEGRKFSLLPTFAYEMEHGLYKLSRRGRFDAIEYTEEYTDGYSTCYLCKDRMYSYGYVTYQRGHHPLKPMSIGPDLVCKNTQCREVRRFFDMVFSYNGMGMPREVDDKAYKRRTKAKNNNKLIKLKTFNFPRENDFDLLMAETLRQMAIEKMTEEK